MVRDNYSLLIEKLDGFIRKYYVNQLLRGALYTVGLVLGLFIVLNVLEYYFYFNSRVRTGMLWGFLLVSGALAVHIEAGTFQKLSQRQGLLVGQFGMQDDHRLTSAVSSSSSTCKAARKAAVAFSGASPRLGCWLSL